MSVTKSHSPIREDAPGLFRATTLQTEADNYQAPMARRGQILSFLNQRPRANTLGFILGPAGSGKTTISIQWAQKLGQDVQYVSTRFYAGAPDAWFNEPDEFGAALADFLNACAADGAEPSEDLIRAKFDQVIELSQH